MLTATKGQFTQVQDSDRKWSVMQLIYVASKRYTLVKEGALINEANIPVQELDSQRGKGAYFGGHMVYICM